MLNRISVPFISEEAITHVLGMLKPKRHTKDVTLFEVGYEAAKADILEQLLRKSNLDTASSADLMLRELRRRKDDAA